MLMRTAPDPAITRTQALLDAAALRLRAPREGTHGPLRFGIDLGTATVVITAVDAAGEPVYGDFLRARVVRDGVVVDFHGAVEAVRKLKASAEAALQTSIDDAATAHPPAVPASECRACAYVLQQAGIECRSLVDEVSAANAVLAVRDGAVVDVGGGSTGVGVYRGGELVELNDVAGGGHHLDLILAGALRMSIEDAEAHKREHSGEHRGEHGSKHDDQVTQILRPGIERVAESIRRLCGGTNPGIVHLAGGALQIPGADAIVEGWLGWPVQAWRHAELITPFGIARC